MVWEEDEGLALIGCFSALDRGDLEPSPPIEGDTCGLGWKLALVTRSDIRRLAPCTAWTVPGYPGHCAGMQHGCLLWCTGWCGN